MKKVILYLALFWANMLFAQYTEWHVRTIATGGSSSNQGTENSPWDLQTALNNPSNKIKPGDVVWLHSGVYTGHYTSSAALSGTELNYITVTSYPGDWAVLNGNIYEYVAPPEGLPDPEGDPNASPASIDEEMSTYSTEEDEGTDAVLLVEGGYVQFMNFEISCIGNLNRLAVLSGNTNCDSANGFHEIVGISHSAATVNKFSNLVIRNMPGEGIGSWKFTDDTEIYGCVIYYNGYIRRNKATCSSTGYNVIGKGPGIYSQNEDSIRKRSIKNNLILNNYDSGFFVWSSSSNPSFDYVRNYDISKNVFINNGSLQRDETANVLIRTSSTSAFNHPHNILVDSNIFYLNSRTADVSGIYLQNSTGVTMSNNLILKGTAGVAFTGNNENIDFQNNLYFGKRMQTMISPTDYSTRNWKMDYNDYYTRYSDFFETAIGSTVYTLPQFQTLYGDELNSTRSSTTDHTTDTNLIWSATAPTKKIIVQNEYNPNFFYVTIFNPSWHLPANDIINVDFTDYGIPNGTVYRIRDVENYFGTPTTGTISSNTIPFPMTWTTIETPIGVLGRDYATAVTHTAKDLHTFIVEFGCNIYYDEYRQNMTESSTAAITAKNRVTLGTNYVANSGSDVIAKASKDIKVIGSSHLKAGSKIHLKIEDPCPDLAYVGEESSSKTSSSGNGSKAVKESADNLLIYPNPSSGIFKLESKKGLKINAVTIFDINSAQMAFEQKYNDEGVVNIDISGRQAGLYTVSVRFEDNSTASGTIIKK